jgi:hypothetical protein
MLLRGVVGAKSGKVETGFPSDFAIEQTRA